MLGIDDLSLRKGRSFATLLVDLETHRPVDLLMGREAETIATWLQQHPGITIVTRDRSEAYAEGVRTGAPDVVQVADRFHLLQNASQAMDELLRTHRRYVDIAVEAAPAPAATSVHDNDIQEAAAGATHASPLPRTAVSGFGERIERMDPVVINPARKAVIMSSTWQSLTRQFGAAGRRWQDDQGDQYLERSGVIILEGERPLTLTLSHRGERELGGRGWALAGCQHRNVIPCQGEGQD